MSAAAAASTACLSALHSGPNLRRNVTAATPIGYEATMSVAMELDTKLLKEGEEEEEEEQHRYSDDPSEDEDRDRSRLSRDASSPPTKDHKNDNEQKEPANGHCNSREASPTPSTNIMTNGDSTIDHTMEPPIHQDDILEDDVEEDEDDVSIAGHSLTSEEPCGYADFPSVDNNHSRNEDTMDDNLQRHAAYKTHGGDVIGRSGSPGRGGHTIRHHHSAMNGGSRPDSSDGDYYDGAGSETSQHHLQLHQPLTLHLQQLRQLGADDGSDDGQSYQCHLCSFTATSKYQLNLHVNAHYDYKCEHCDYTSRTEGRLKRHLKDFHAELPVDDFSPGSDSGKLSSNGGPNQPNKVKTYRCKQCSFVATVKTEFWDHSKTHIKAERLLTCPRCPFVTEYKHHLEYHLRNHFGSKPFKCPKCNYSCVNKSMLNSHMKSHSNIYQYRCADCTYATKYCHSLKLHLRKYGHKPATVLNPDGSPNPMPVIDVYGTRRGPRPKKTQQHQDQMYTNGGNGNSGAGGPLAFSPMQLPSVNGALSPNNVLPFFYGPPPPSLLPNGFHANGNDDGLLQQQQQHQQSGHIAKSQQTSSHSNGVVGGGDRLVPGGAVLKGGDNVSENGRYRCPSGQQGALRCNLCEFHTDHRDQFSKHMLSHAAAENQDLCNLYGISSETLMQDPNHQSPMNVAAMAAMATALGLNPGGGVGHPGQRPQLETRHHHHQQHSGAGVSHLVTNQDPNADLKSTTNPHQMHQGGFKGNGRQHQQHQSSPQHADDKGHQMAHTAMMPNPLEHLRGFSEQFNIQPFMVREYSTHLFPTPSGNSSVHHSGRAGGGEGTSGDGLPVTIHSPNGQQRAHNDVSPSSHQQQANQNKVTKGGGAIRVGSGSSGGRVLHSTPRSDSGTVPGLRPLDLSSAKVPVGRSMPWHHHDLHQHLQQQYASQQQQFYVQQQQHQQLQQLRGRPISPIMQQGPNRGGLLEIATIVPDDIGGAGPSPSCTTSPTQSKNRRKGRAFKLDRICMKLQKERASPPPGYVGDVADDSNMDGSDRHGHTLSPEPPSSKQEVYADDAPAPYDGLCIKTEVVCDDNDVKTAVATDDDVSAKSSVKCLPISPPVVLLSPPEAIKPVPDAVEGATDVPAPKIVDSNLVVSTEKAPVEESKWNDSYQCQYCEIAFKDCIMYAVHMGYHGFKDPFKCNMCGQQTKDKVAFFLHIARTAHL